ncbi:MAG TPA: NAD(P)/FAD-dependent oxidoreductase [Thermoanaerobaculia bacterium]|nr:NAD(P)/FAD-dependent oxidoreductase [Thermoanaerobaculia bacterium]
MARSPLFRALRRALRLAVLSPGAEPGSPVGRQGANGLARPSRRDALRLGGVALAGVAAARCASVVPVATGPDEVLVVGGGIGGLTAAWRLKQAGVAVQVLEAQERIGGRMLSLRGHFPEGIVAELGAELIDTDHSSLRALAAELGLELDDLLVEPPGVTETVFFHGARRSEAELVEAMRPVVEAARRDLALLGEEPDVTWRGPEAARVLDALSIAAWLEKAGISGWAKTLVGVAFESECGLPPGDQSCLNFLLFASFEPEHPKLYGDSDERFHIRGGNDQVPSRLAEKLGERVLRGTRLEALRMGSDGRYVATVRRAGTSGEVRASHVVLALPFTLLRQVRLDVPLSPAKRRAIAELGYGTNAKLMTGWSGRAWRLEHGSTGTVMTDAGFQVAWETSRAQKGTAGVLTNFSGGAEGIAVGRGTPAERASELATRLDSVFLGISSHHRPQEAVRFHWPTHPWTLGSYACYRTGQVTAFGGAEGEREGGVFFAGEHTSRDFQGFMEGACESGERAAKEVLAAMGIPASQSTG